MFRTISLGNPSSLGPCIRAQSVSEPSPTIMEPSTEPHPRDDRQSQDSIDTDSESGSQESAKARIERLGRQRPSVFHSTWAEVAFVFSIAMSQVLTETFVSGFTVILPILVRELDVPSASLVWPATAFSLPIAASLLFFGRLGDMYGGYIVYVAGMIWLSLWSVVAGFSTSPLMLIFCRALQGLGAAAFLPTGVMLMGSIYRPGPRKNLVFSIYGASAVLGFFTGIFFAGVVGQYTRWGWYFWIGAILSAITALSSYLSIPSDSAERRSNGVTMDWLGAALIFCGLSLTVYAITDSAHAPQGWRTPYILALLLLGCSLVAAAFYHEGWSAKAPLLPFSIFAVKSMTPLIVALMLNYGVLGVYLVYATQYMQLFMGASPLQVVAWYVPMIVGGIFLSTAGGFILHLIPGRALLAFSGTGWIVALLCFAIAPMGANYWAFTFPR